MLERQRTGAILFGAVFATLIVFLLPSHGFVGRPLIYLHTLCHELGHGITGWLTGGSFEEFVIYPGGGGTAFTAGGNHALVCAGGLLGPAVVACFGFVLARRARSAQATLLVAAAALLVLTLLVAGNLLTMVYMPALALLLGWIAARKNAEPAQLALVFLSTQLALSVFSRGDYLFKNEAVNARGVSPSDVATMASELGGPYWLWGAVVGALSVLTLVAGLWLFTRSYPQLRMRSRMSKLRTRD